MILYTIVGNLTKSFLQHYYHYDANLQQIVACVYSEATRSCLAPNISCLAPIYRVWPQYIVSGPNISCLTPIYRVCPQYIVSDPNISCLPPIYRVCPQYIVPGPNISCLAPIYRVCPQYIVSAPNISCLDSNISILYHNITQSCTFSHTTGFEPIVHCDF